LTIELLTPFVPQENLWVSGTGFFTVLNALSITQPVQALKETKTLAIDKFNPEPLFMAGKVIYHLWPYSHR